MYKKDNWKPFNGEPDAYLAGVFVVDVMNDTTDLEVLIETFNDANMSGDTITYIGKDGYYTLYINKTELTSGDLTDLETRMKGINREHGFDAS